MLPNTLPRNFVLISVICTLSLLAEYAGYFSSWNQRLGDTRMALSQRPADGQIVLVAVDSQSLTYVGNWPWSRAVHASLLDTFTEAGAVDVFFDFDFTFPGDPEGDLAFARALERAGGATYLAVFEQIATVTDPASRHYNFPLPAFAQNSWPALVNVQTDTQGFVRHYPYGAQLGDDFVMSAGALIANTFQPDVPSFEIDFSINAGSIPVYSASDVLRGRIPLDHFLGRTVIVGATAVELADQLAVPVQGILPGALLHVLAAESLTQGRAILWMRVEWVGLGLALVLFVLNAARRPRLTICVGGTALVVLGVELAALALFRSASVMVPTAMLYPGLCISVLLTFAKLLQTSNWLVLKKSAEARNTLCMLERVFDEGMDGIVILGSDGTVLRHSASAAEILGADAAGGLNLPERLRRAEPTPQSAPRRTIELQSGSSTKILEYRATSSNVEYPSGMGKPPRRDTVTTLMLRDITQLKEQEQDIAYLSNYDDRTGALRRNAFLAFLDLRLSDGFDAAVFALSLDRFKTVNVTLGRSVGDTILKEVVRRLEESPLLLSAPVRLSGTSFAVYTESAVDLSEVDQVAQDLLEDIARVYHLKDVNAQVGVRIGYTAVRGGSEMTAERALDQAVEAMDAAKARGVAIAQFDHSAWEKQKRAREIESAMKAALENGEFHLLYQPQHRISDGTLIGVEALIRWESPILGPVFPDEFIGIAESTGFIVELGNWTLEQSAKDAVRLPSDIVVAVNISGIQMMRGNLLEDTARILKQVGLPPDRLCFELTESVMVAASDGIIETMQDLSFLGISWALDDFGTGFSSMAYLSRMPLDKVKLDKSFTMNLQEDPTARPVLHSTNELCRGLGVKLLCEGVETQEQLDILVEEGCDEAQGYLFGKPIPIHQLLSNVGNLQSA